MLICPPPPSPVSIFHLKEKAEKILPFFFLLNNIKYDKVSLPFLYIFFNKEEKYAKIKNLPSLFVNRTSVSEKSDIVVLKSIRRPDIT